MPITYICQNCGQPIRDGEPFDFTNGDAWHSNLVYCIRRQRAQIDELRQRQGYVRPIVGRVYEIKQGGPTDE